MSLIPFILDLADELHEFSRCLTSGGMDVDDFGFGIYPHELQLQQQHLYPQQSLLRRPRTVSSQLYWLPSIKQRPHPYSRSKTCCAKSATSSTNTDPESSREAASINGAVQDATAGVANAGAAVSVAKSAYSVVNKNGFQVSMNVKQFAPNELTVRTIDNCIVVEGQHEDKEDGHGVISRHFIRKYMLPKGYNPAEVLSTLSSDGILTVKAPPPPTTKTDKPLERIVDIQQTGPAHLSVKEATKEQTPMKTAAAGIAATTTIINQQQLELQSKPQKQQQQQQSLQQKVAQKFNEHNGGVTKNLHTTQTELETEPEMELKSKTVDTTNPETGTISGDIVGKKSEDVQEEIPILAANNNIVVVAPAGVDGSNADENDEDATTNNNVNNAAANIQATNGGIADVPAVAAAIPAYNDVVAMETEMAPTCADATNSCSALPESGGDESIVAVIETQTETEHGIDGDVALADETSAAMKNIVVASASAATAAAVAAAVLAPTIVTAQPILTSSATTTTTTADLLAAADAAILLAKAQNNNAATGENGNSIASISEEVVN